MVRKPLISGIMSLLVMCEIDTIREIFLIKNVGVKKLKSTKWDKLYIKRMKIRIEKIECTEESNDLLNLVSFILSV